MVNYVSCEISKFYSLCDAKKNHACSSISDCETVIRIFTKALGVMYAAQVFWGKSTRPQVAQSIYWIKKLFLTIADSK